MPRAARKQKRLGFAEDTRPFEHEEIVEGIDARRVQSLIDRGVLTEKQVYRVIPERTFNRRLANGQTLKISEADVISRLLRINEILDEKVRPYLMGDGGYLEILDLTDHTLKIRYQGACGTCPSSLTGTLMAIESMLKEQIDPELEVIAV